ncbi:site-2 protease family protein [Massilia litorea]|uniref:Site-2 protease family protein n=1 Tax=Massilia litorea TaxID=2769491 RepID=A0A7L9U6K9_9BURK|nr:site-2 protease family protein [Massilia litorea]QOL50681.1 site-2 protease family protein [Massilia litorea]
MKLLLLLLSAGKLGKLLTSGGTMLLSVLAYAFVYGWWYALGFVALLFCHEMGHFLAARQRGLPVGLPTFIPFVGAWIEMKELPKDVETEAYVGIAGPVAGTVAALACYALAREFDSRLLLALAYAGCFLNLFNLIPISPLDGGRITAILSPRLWLLGVPVLAAAFFWRPSPILILIVILALPQLKAAWNWDPAAAGNQAYYAVSSEDKFTYGAFYVGLIVFLCLMVHGLHTELGPAR